MNVNPREICWCGLPVWKHIKEAERLEAQAGYQKPKPARKRYPKLPVLELDNEPEPND